ncbi:uncharacterized protein Z518_04938 [Rhinocladiella mackenziei CBS 650.93]|uniref:Ribophorin II C-terminal domain-containing protein n=1 Tax=Rhinocladiella mackenziei CBS 650.93 TaxID=1442369 RepID=A0A0D2FXB5_9EURO|nr:uncharacterized protein Z518_04938 [Rhinocladiella mackenziei CBS 650.93]KIX06962.1 hypothetical protein Z518_04938 [Rhinocladiella mackenziei CBS 650.93]
MRLQSLLSQALLVLSTLSSSAAAAASWTFTDGSVNVAAKGAGVGVGLKEKLVPFTPLSAPVKFGAGDTLKVVLTTQEGKSAKRPHQAFLLLQDTTSKLDVSYPFSVKESGKAKVELTHKDLPIQFLRTTSSIDASIVIASFGSSVGYNSAAFMLTVELDPNVPVPVVEKPLRYGKLPEIHHIFRPDPTSPNVVISMVILGIVLASLPSLLGAWMYLGGNINHLSKALTNAPISHGLFVGSIIGIEGVFFLYYTSWNLFQTLPVLFAFGLVAFLSGSRALTEVHERRLAGLR